MDTGPRLGAGSARPTGYSEALDRLSPASAQRHTHAADLGWDDPGTGLDPGGFGYGLPDFDPLASTAWYRSLDPAEAQRLALARYASCMKVGWQFENYLQQGLLRFALTLPDGAPEFRYLHHELREESEHTVMFAEFVARSGMPTGGMPSALHLLARLAVVPLARRRPALFFLFVLAGEEPIDTFQRLHLGTPGSTHPMVERIMRIHVAEEARHLSFARRYLTEAVPRLGRLRRAELAVAGPVVLGVMARLMFRPPTTMVRQFRIPRATLAEAFGGAPARRRLAGSVARARRLCADLGLTGPATHWLWKAAGVSE